MSPSAERFANLLTTAVNLIKAREHKNLSIIQDELGHALGRDNGSAIEYWRKGYVPSYPADLEQLAAALVQRRGLDATTCIQFLRYGGHANPETVTEQLFSTVDKKPLPPAPLLARSPFVAGPAITHPRQFFGREQLLKRIFYWWQHAPLQHAAIIGPKRSGKTSLLYYLQTITRTPAEQLRPGQKQDWLPQPAPYRWLLVDFQDPRLRQRERLLRYILTELALPVSEPCDLDSFMDTISYRLQRPTIIMLDELGAGLAAPELDLAFWWSLRSLAINYANGHLGFVIASQAQPSVLAEDKGKPSPFFNLFHTLPLGPLTVSEAESLIASSPHPFDPADVAWIVEQSGCWPLLVQLLCQARLNALQGIQAETDWRQEGLQQIAPYRYLLDAEAQA